MVWKGRHGQNDQEYMDGRSPAGQAASGTSKNGPKNHMSRWKFRDEMPVLPGEKPTPLKSALRQELEFVRLMQSDTRQADGKFKPERKIGGPKGLPDSEPG
jgi:hypothetical protein